MKGGKGLPKVFTGKVSGFLYHRGALDRDAGVYDRESIDLECATPLTRTWVAIPLDGAQVFPTLFGDVRGNTVIDTATGSRWYIDTHCEDVAKVIAPNFRQRGIEHFKDNWLTQAPAFIAITLALTTSFVAAC